MANTTIGISEELAAHVVEGGTVSGYSSTALGAPTVTLARRRHEAAGGGGAA